MIACGTSSVPSADDRQAYRALVAVKQVDADRDLPACRALRDPALANDCALYVAERAGVQADNPGKWCSSLTSGVWQDECWFQAAEHRRQQRRRDEAIAACKHSGQFRDRCDYHLWQEDVLRAERGLSSADVDGSIVRGRPIFAEWDTRLGPDWRASADELPLGAPASEATFAEVFWTRWFEQLFEHDPRPDVGRCDAQGELATACVDGTVDVLRRRAIDRVGHACSGFPADVALQPAWWAGQGIDYVADPRLTSPLSDVCTHR